MKFVCYTFIVLSFMVLVTGAAIKMFVGTLKFATSDSNVVV